MGRRLPRAVLPPPKRLRFPAADPATAAGRSSGPHKDNGARGGAVVGSVRAKRRRRSALRVVEAQARRRRHATVHSPSPPRPAAAGAGTAVSVYVRNAKSHALADVPT